MKYSNEIRMSYLVKINCRPIKLGRPAAYQLPFQTARSNNISCVILHESIMHSNASEPYIFSHGYLFFLRHSFHRRHFRSRAHARVNKLPAKSTQAHVQSRFALIEYQFENFLKIIRDSEHTRCCNKWNSPPRRNWSNEKMAFIGK